MSDIFLSYKREDQTEAQLLAASLEVAGWSVWWDRRLRSGEHFDDVIERELKNAKCVIVLWSHQSVGSQYVKDEATYALNHQKLIPVAIEKVEPPLRFQSLHTLSLAGWSGSESFPAFMKLREDVTSVAGSPVNGRPSHESSTGARSDAHPPARRDRQAVGEEREATPQSEDPAPPSWESAFGATAAYKGFQPTGVADQFSLKIYTNTFAGQKTADERAEKEVRAFMKREGYASYDIVKGRHNFFLQSYEYIVRFSRK